MMNEAQQKAVEHRGKPLLIIAGAGTGKTSVITNKIVHAIEHHGVKPEQILALTYTEKAAHEMFQRVEKKVTVSFGECNIMTFHSFAQTVVSKYGVLLGISSDARLMDETESWHVVYKHLDEFSLPTLRPRGNPSASIKDLLKHISRLKDEAITSDEYLAYAESLSLDGDTVEQREQNSLTKELAQFYHEYQRTLRNNNLMDFGDLLLYAHEIVKRSSVARAALQKDYTDLFIDEFQDTNIVQYEFIKALYSASNELTVVADDDQSIYKFRGASVSNVMQFTKDFSDYEKVVLTQNYRSAQNILDVAYTVISNNNPDRLEVQLGIDKKLQSQTGEEGIVTLRTYHSGDEEAAHIASQCQKLLESGVSPDEIAIITRSNSAALPYVHALERAGIPVTLSSRTGMLRETVVLDILAGLTFLVHPHDSVAFHRLLKIPELAFPHNDYIAVAHQAHEKGNAWFRAFKEMEVGEMSEQGQACRDKLFTLLENFGAQARRQKVSYTIVTLLEELGITKKITQSATREDETVVRELSVINTFLEWVREFEQREIEHDASALLAFVKLMLDSGDEGDLDSFTLQKSGSVQVMTAHKSKGLEFGYVFVVSVASGRFPNQNRKDRFEIPSPLIKEMTTSVDEHLAEERRLFYVALTRAKKGLFVSYAKRYGAGKQEKKPSIFLAELELPFELIEKVVVEAPRDIIATPHEFPQPVKFSHSSLQTFASCPLRYKYKYVLKIPTRGTAASSMGNSIHATLEQFYILACVRSSATQGNLFGEVKEKVIVPSLTELLELYEKNWEDAWFKSRAEHDRMKKAGEHMLCEYYAKYDGVWTLPLHLEKSFVLKIDEFTINGKIDRIDTFVDGVAVVDYKTGKPKAEIKSDPDAKQQLMVYQWACEEALSLPVKKLTYYFLENQHEVSFIGGEKELDTFKRKTRELMETAKNSDFEPTPSLYTCASCDYRDFCEFREL